ncbi:hypothetical protein J6590_086719 [Homalodisca vitripennis]|nr:hypothetical protein J6590_086719 [Homalodisca vitripennis]
MRTHLVGAGGLRDVTLRMPVAVPTGSTASLLCLYDLEGDQLYTVKWYKGRQEFFRYVLKELPHTRVFALPGINVDAGSDVTGSIPNWGATAKHVICPYVAPLGFGVLYNFGETVSIPYWTSSWQPDSFYDKICSNKSRGLHTLCLLEAGDTSEIVACISSQVGCTWYLYMRWPQFHILIHQEYSFNCRRKPYRSSEVVASGAEMVVLRDVQKFLSGKYRCEVSSDAPHFHTEVVSGYMHVVNELLEEPVIRLEKNSYSAGDTLRANCSSPPSSPPANVTWYQW